VDEKPIEIPGSRWEWLLADKRRLAALVAGVLVLLGVAAALAVPALLGPVDGEDEPPVVEPVPPGGSADTTGTADGGAEPTTTPDGDGDGGSGEADGSPGGDGGSGDGSPGGSVTVAPGRAPYVAYRFAGAIWVSREDGSDAVKVAESVQGDFALSPDGSAVALVDQGVLTLVNVTGLSATVIGDAEPHALAWEADSSSVLYLRAVQGGHGETEVWRAPRRAGAAPVKVVQAGAPAVASDGTIVALPVPGAFIDPTEGILWVLPSGRSARQTSTQGPPGACAVQGGTIAYAVTGMSYADSTGAEKQIDPEIRVMRADGSASRRIVGKPATARPFGYANLALSPDGQRLLYAEVGDDGYSRAWIVTLAGGTPLPLTVRRDTYPLGWSADGTSVFLIEGNEFQGEPTALISVRADGTARRTVVQGAGL
jgi:hypothetical protein